MLKSAVTKGANISPEKNNVFKSLKPWVEMVLGYQQNRVIGKLLGKSLKGQFL